MDTALRTQRKIIFLENLERDTEIDIKNKVDYNTAMNYRKCNPVPRSHNAFLGSLRLCAERLTTNQPTSTGSGLKPLRRRIE